MNDMLYHLLSSEKLCYMVDHDKKLYEEIKQIDSSLGSIENLVNMTLNTKVIKTYMNHERIQFSRALSGIIGFRVEREEKLDNYHAQVYYIHHMELVTTTRKEHLEAYKELARHQSNTSAMTKIVSLDLKKKLNLGGHHDSNESLTSTNQNLSDGSVEKLDKLADQLKNEPSKENAVDTYINQKKTSLMKYRESLPEPSRSNITMEEYFFPDSCDREKTDFYLGRSMQLKEKRKTYKATVWMCQEFPFSLQDLLPLLDIMSPSNGHFAKLKEFVEMKLPLGFPIKVGKSLG